jgi:hypothetical protein
MHVSKVVKALAITALLTTTVSGVATAAAAPCTPTWKLVTVPSLGLGQVTSVAALSTKDVRFTGDLEDYTGSREMRWNGTAVREGTEVPQAPMTGTLAYAASYDSASDGWVSETAGASRLGTVERWHGGRWTMVPLAVSPKPRTEELTENAIGAVSPTDAWAVGYSAQVPNILVPDGAVIEHWNGVAWSIVPNPASGLSQAQIEGIKVVSSKNIWAVGAQAANDASAVTPLVEHWNGTRWSSVAVPDGTGPSAFHAMSASGPNDIWAVGGQTQPGTSNTAISLVEHWNGSAWSVVKNLPNLGNARLDSVYASGPNDVWALAETPSEINEFVHWNGEKWTMVLAPGPQELGLDYAYLGLSGTGPDDVWAVGGVTNDTNVVTSPQIAHLTCGKA